MVRAIATGTVVARALELPRFLGLFLRFGIQRGGLAEIAQDVRHLVIGPSRCRREDREPERECAGAKARHLPVTERLGPGPAHVRPGGLGGRRLIYR